MFVVSFYALSLKGIDVFLSVENKNYHIGSQIIVLYLSRYLYLSKKLKETEEH